MLDVQGTRTTDQQQLERWADEGRSGDLQWADLGVTCENSVANLQSLAEAPPLPFTAFGL